MQQLAGFGFGDIFDAVDDAFDSVGGLLNDNLPFLTAAVGAYYGGPQGAMTGFQLGARVYSANQAREGGKEAQEQYAKAAKLANYLASAGIDISGNDPGANALIQKLSQMDYDFQSDEARALIDAYIDGERRQSSTESALYLVAGVVVAGALFYALRRKK